MEMASSKSLTYRFGIFEVRTSTRQLFRQGRKIQLQDQPFELLVALLENPGKLVSRDELRRRLWSADTFVEFDNSLKVAVKKLRDALGDDADNPRFVETIPRLGYRFLAPVAAAEEGLSTAAAESGLTTPSARSSLSSLSSLSRESAPGQTKIPSSAPERNLRWVAGLVAALLVAAFALWLQHRAGKAGPGNITPNSSPVSVVPRKSVAVLGFRNASARKDSAWLSTALSEMLSTELAAGNQLRLISGEEVASLKNAAAWSQADTLAPETTNRLGTALGSNLIVTGSYTRLGPDKSSQFRLDARIQEATTGRILAEVAETTTDQDLFPLVSRIGMRLREGLALPGVTGDQLTGVRASVSKDLDAQRFYSLGLERIRQYDALTARDLLQQAVKSDPQFAMARWALANAWETLGYNKNGADEAKKAYEESAPLPVAERLLIEGSYYETRPDWKKAASTYRSLFALFPDSVDYGLRLTHAQWVSGEPMAAQETINALRRLPKPDSDDPRIDLREARIVASRDRNGAIELARAAARKSQDRGLRLGYAHARDEECTDLGWAGRPQEAMAACNQARELFLAAGDQGAAARVAQQIADLYQEQGQYTEALRWYQDGLKSLRRSGDQANIGNVLNNMALILEAQGDLVRAGKMYEEAAQIFRDTGEISNLTVAMDNIADIRVKNGDMQGALVVAKAALETARSNSAAGFVVDCLNALAALQEMAGNLKDAHQLADESLSLERKIGIHRR